MPKNTITRVDQRLVMSATSRVAKVDGRPVQRVTTILNALAKPALVQWSADMAANYAIDYWDDLSNAPVTQRLSEIRYAHRARNKSAQLAGTEVHSFGERLVQGESVDPPDELRGMVEAYARFLDEWRIEPISVETPVAFTGNAPYAGRADLWARIGVRDNASALVDLKTGKGVYPEVVLQLAAYLACDLWQPDGPQSETTKPDVELVYVAHITADHVDMHPIPAAKHMQQWRTFRYVQQVSDWLGRHSGFEPSEPLIGEPESKS